MKKFLLIISICSLAPLSNAMAKTEGNYVGVDVIRTYGTFDKAKFKGVTYKDFVSTNLTDEKHSTDSVGINYKHAFNLKAFGLCRFYLAPSVVYDYSKFTIKDADGSEYSLDHRYGAKLDLGFDITKNLAAFINVGILNNKAVVRYVDAKGEEDLTNEIVPTYGFGIKYSIIKNLDVNLSYEFSKYLAITPAPNPGDAHSKVFFKLQTARLGTAYRF